MRLTLDIEGEGPVLLDLPAEGADLVAFMSFAVSRGFGAQHPLIALADRLHEAHRLPLGPLTTFYDTAMEDAEDVEKRELAWQPAAELRAALERLVAIIGEDPQAQALLRRAGAEGLGAQAAALIPALRRAARPPGLRAVIRRRKSAVGARSAWLASPWARLLNSQAAMAALTPRAARIIDLVDLRPGRRYVDIGCGTAAYAHLLAARAGLGEPPLTLDIAPGPGVVDVIAWPEHLPLRDASVDALTCLYFIRRFDDDVVHNFGGELARVLAPGGAALVMEVAPVRNGALNRLHARLLSPGCAEVDLRGWGRLAALFTECGFDSIDLVNVGPFLLPPIPRVGVLLRRAPGGDGPAAEPEPARELALAGTAG